MKLIKLTQNKFAKIDDEDFKKLNKYKWYFHLGYAKRGVYDKDIKNNRILSMQREILGLSFGDKQVVDHINKNTLDNRKCNLRICSQQENTMGKIKDYRKLSSKYKGVFYRSKTDMWTAQIKYNYKKIMLGDWETEEMAAFVYNLKAKELFGEYAVLNNLPEKSYQLPSVKEKKLIGIQKMWIKRTIFKSYLTNILSIIYFIKTHKWTK